jgi:hypothetical protein
LAAGRDVEPVEVRAADLLDAFGADLAGLDVVVDFPFAAEVVDGRCGLKGLLVGLGTPPLVLRSGGMM